MTLLNFKCLAGFCSGFCLVLILTSCTSQLPVREFESNQLPLGLYEVVARDCSYSPGAPEDCTRTRYLELVQGIFPSFDENDVALVTWLSDSPDREYVYNVRDLRGGKFVGTHEYVLEDDSLGKDWFVLREGTITDYFFVRYPRKTPVGDMTGRTHFVLRRISRAGKIKQLLQYPAFGD